jgi:hAT family C-terminal dimerisation region
MPCLTCLFTLLTKSTATSIDVERLFSRGHLVLSHTRSRLSVSSTRALLCLGSWSLIGLVRDDDVKAVASLDEIQGRIELEKLGELLRIRA